MIVITAPSGLIGHQVLANLLNSGEQLRLIARDPAGLSAEARAGAEVIEGSHGDPAVVDEAFAGADAVFWLAPPDPRAQSVEAAYVGFTRPAAEAFKKHGVERAVGVSALGRGTPWAAHAGYVAGSLAMDDLIASSGAAYRALTNPSFMDNIIRQAEAIKNQGMFFSPIDGGRKLPAVATRDIAAAAARLLLDDSWSGAGEVPLLGPEDLSFNDMAGIISEVLGKEVRFQQTTFEAYQDRFVSFGMTDAMAQGMTDMAWAKNEGLDNAVPRTPENSTPTSFREWCEKALKPAVLDQTDRQAASRGRGGGSGGAVTAARPTAASPPAGSSRPGTSPARWPTRPPAATRAT
jgi:uncharacterized protein YbjT (DUF2867 family)